MVTSTSTNQSLFPSQLEGVQFILNNEENSLIGDEMGTGKTRLSLAYGKYLLHAGLADRILVVLPAQVIQDFAKEIVDYYGFEPEYYNSKKKLKDNWITIVSYQTLRTKKKQQYHHVTRILEHFDGKKILLIADEAHYLCNDESSTHTAISCIRAAYKLAMTGTPVQNKPEDLFGILKFLDPTWDKEWFYQTFVIRKLRQVARNRKVWKIVSYKNQEMLNQLLKNVMIRRLKKDTTDIPEKMVKFMPYLNDDKLYDRVLDDVGMSDENMMVKVGRLMSAASGLDPYDNTRYIPGAKYKVLRHLIEAHDGRILLWFRRLETLNHVKKLLEADGLDVYEWSGGNRVHRNKQAALWKQSTAGLLLSTIKAGGTGINLVEAKTAIFFECELSPSDNRQAEDRIHRTGQTEKTTIIYLYGERTVEQCIIELVQKKAHINKVVVDSYTPEDLKQIYKYSFSLRYE